MGSRGGTTNDLDLPTEVSAGAIVGKRRVFQTGVRTIPVAITTLANAEDIWPGVSKVYPLPTAAVQLEVVSDSALDSVGGTGMQTLTLNCLDTAWSELLPQTIGMNGTTPVAVPTANKYRINSVVGGMSANNPNVRQKNVGTITIRDVGGGTVRAVIPPEAGALQQCVYTVPAGQTLFLFSIETQILSSAGGGSTRGADFALEFHNPTGYSIQSRYISCTDVAPYQLKADTRIRLNEKTDFIIRCIYTSANNLKVGASWEGHLRRN